MIMRKLFLAISIIASILLLCSCNQKNELWGNTIDDLLNSDLNSKLTTPLNLDYISDDIIISLTKTLCTENCIIIELISQNYDISNALLYAEDIADNITPTMPFEDIKNTYYTRSAGISSFETPEGIYQYRIFCFGDNAIASSNYLTLVITDNDQNVPIVFSINITNYGNTKSIPIKDSFGNTIGTAKISALYADIFLTDSMPVELDAFMDNLYLKNRGYTDVPFEMHIFSGGNHEILIEFRRTLNIDLVNYLLYKN